MHTPSACSHANRAMRSNQDLHLHQRLHEHRANVHRGNLMRHPLTNRCMRPLRLRLRARSHVAHDASVPPL
jgi:2-phospho-L-lactate transferase/gluconeogenesis factor (CofD/UPF0052 family)